MRLLFKQRLDVYKRQDQLRLRVRPGKLCERGHDVLHRLSVILAPVTGHKLSLIHIYIR